MRPCQTTSSPAIPCPHSLPPHRCQAPAAPRQALDSPDIEILALAEIQNLSMFQSLMTICLAGNHRRRRFGVSPHDQSTRGSSCSGCILHVERRKSFGYLAIDESQPILKDLDRFFRRPQRCMKVLRHLRDLPSRPPAELLV